VDRSETEQFVTHRRTNRLAPGYKDAGKDDGGVGDALIWRTILHLGTTKKQDVIFVSMDEKADWWHRSEKTALYPRFDLANEFWRLSGGRTFHQVRFSEVLALFEVPQDVVAEVREGETELGTTYEMSYDQYVTRIVRAEKAVRKWARRRYSALRDKRTSADELDIHLLDEDEEYIGINIIVAPGRLPGMFLGDVQEKALRGHWYRDKYALTVFALAIVAEDKGAAAAMLAYLESHATDLPETHFHVGYLDGRGAFVEIDERRI
jgi:hypothetical protein